MYQALLSLHVLFAIFWFGSVLFMDFVVIPAMQAMPREAQSLFLRSITPRLSRALTLAGALTILLGIAVGLVKGVVGQLDTSYGRNWLAALVIGLLIYLWGLRVVAPAAEKLNMLSTDSPDFAAQSNRVKMCVMLELAGFLVIFVLMMRMRFGY